MATCPPYTAVQTSAQQATVQNVATGIVRRAAGVKFTGLDVSNSHLATWNDESVDVFRAQCA